MRGQSTPQSLSGKTSKELLMTNPIPTRDEVKAFLASLGTTEDEVAAAVIAAGIRESNYTPRTFHCPLAQLLEQRFGVPFSVIPDDIIWDDGSERATNPEPVRRFILVVDKQFLLAFADGDTAETDVRWPELYGPRSEETPS